MHYAELYYLNTALIWNDAYFELYMFETLTIT